MAMPERSMSWSSFVATLHKSHRVPGVLHGRLQNLILASREALQVGHRADEGIGEPLPLQLYRRPWPAAGCDPQLVRLTARVIQQQSQFHEGCATVALDAKSGVLETSAKIVVMVDR